MGTSSTFRLVCGSLKDVFFRKWMTLNCELQGQPRSNIMTDLNSQHMVSYLLSIQTMALSVIVFEIFSIFVCMGNPIPTPILHVFGVKDHQIVTVDISRPQKGYLTQIRVFWAVLGTSRAFRLVCGPIKGVFFKWMTLNCEFQGQLRSNILTDLNSQHMVSYLLPIQTMALSVTVFEIFDIFFCMENPIPTPNFESFWDNRPPNRNGCDFWTPRGHTLHRSASFEPLWTLLALSVWSVALWRIFVFENGWPWIVSFKVNPGQI